MNKAGVATNKAVLAYLKKHADEDGFVEASGASIAFHLQKKPRTVQVALKRLEEKGRIVSPVRRQFVLVRAEDF